MTILRNLAVVSSCVMVFSLARADDLSRILERDKILAQKLVADVQAALGQARALEKSDPAQGLEILKKARNLLENDNLLSDQKRLGLLQQVKGRLREVEEIARAKKIKDDLSAQQTAQKILQEQKTFAKTAIGKNNTIARDFISSTQVRLDKSQRLKYARENGFLDVLGQIDESAAKITEERITKRFIEITELRKPKLDPKLKEVLEALNRPITVDYDRTEFKEVIEDLKKKLGQPIFVNENTLKETLTTDYTTPVTLKADKVMAKTVLRVILADLGLAYVIREGTIHVMTIQRARETMVTRFYPVQDFVGTSNGTPLGQAMMMMNVQSLINLVQNSVDPAIWQMGGSIFFDPPTMSLVVRAPAEIHGMIPLGR